MKGSGRIVTGAAALAVALAGCSVNVYEAGSGEGGAAGGGGADEAANTGSISIAGAATGVDGNAIQAVIDAATEGKEYSATYTGSDSFEQNVIIQIEGGTPPDLGFWPQPGAVVEQAQQGNVIALEDLGFDIAQLEERFGTYMMSLGEYEGKHYGMPDSLNFKSAIWYNVPAWEEAGWGEFPTTWEDLMALSQEIADSGTTPWCIGTGSEAATGWPATDWMEDITLRQAGTDAYDSWVEGTLDFASPEITAAAETFGEVVFADGFVFGGHENIAGTDFRDAPDPMFNDPPNCYMHRQATFIPAFFPEGLTPVEDYNFFPFPDIDGQSGTLMAGGLISVFNNRPEIRDFLDAYTGEDAQCVYGQAEPRTQVSANFSVPLDCYENPLTQQAAEKLQADLSNEVARFDASDLMPPSVGSGSFWTGMNDYTNDGPDNLESVLQSIDAAWPSGGAEESTGTGS